MKKEATHNWDFQSISGLVLIIIWTYTGLDKLIRLPIAEKPFTTRYFLQSFSKQTELQVDRRSGLQMSISVNHDQPGPK